MRKFYKGSIVILLVLTVLLCSGFKNIYEESYDKKNAGSFDVYFKNKEGDYKFYKTLYYDKNVSTKKFNIDKKIYGIKLVKKSGYEVNIDELTLNNKTDNNYQRKLKDTDNDLIEVSDSTEFNISGKGTLVISARCPLKLKGTEYAIQFPTSSEPKDYVNYKLDSNVDTVSDDELIIPSRKNIIYEKYNVKPASGHPDAPISYYVSNDDEYLYVFTEVFSDNTYDHGKDYSKVIVNDGVNTKEYQVNTVEENEYGKWWFEYTNNVFDIDYQHMLYLVKIPVKDFNNDKLKLAFEYYGTLAGYDLKKDISFVNKNEDDEYINEGKFRLYGTVDRDIYEDDSEPNIYTLFDKRDDFFDGKDLEIDVELYSKSVESGNNVFLDSIYYDGAEDYPGYYFDYDMPVFANYLNDELKLIPLKLKQISTSDDYLLDNKEYDVFLQVDNCYLENLGYGEFHIHYEMSIKILNGSNFENFKFINYKEKINPVVDEDDEVVEVPDTKQSLSTYIMSVAIIAIIIGLSIVVLNSKKIVKDN